MHPVWVIIKIHMLLVTMVTRIRGKDKPTMKFVVQFTITATVTAAGRASCRNISATMNHGILPEGI